MSETYYHIVNAMQRGDRDAALSVAADGLDELIDFYVTDGFTDDDILSLVREKIASLRAEQ